MTDKKKPPTNDPLWFRAKKLGLWSVTERWEQVAKQPWLPELLDWEEEERAQRSLDRRLRKSRIGRFKAMADFDWAWPEKIDRELVDELFTFRFIEECSNVVLVGPNGVGKTMIAQNLAHQSLMNGLTVCFTTAAKMLGDLNSQTHSSALEHRLRRYTQPAVLAVDEVGYLSYDNRHADLLFEVVTRRYNEKPTIITTNKSFGDWNTVFPNAACVVTLVDRLVHHSEILEIKAESYRFKEAQERVALRARKRGSRTKVKAPHAGVEGSAT